MTNTQNPAPIAVLNAYASATKRADQALLSISDRFLTPLEAAKSALQLAKDGELKNLEDAHESTMLKACQKYETEYRRAGSTHGLSITGLLDALNKRKSAITTSHDVSLHDVRNEYQLVCHGMGSHDHPVCLPAYDALLSAEHEADKLRDRQLAESHALYLEHKAEHDIIYNDRLSELLLEKNETIAKSQESCSSAVTALRVPLEAAVADAQAQHDEALQAATDKHEVTRQARLEILHACQEHSISERQAIARFDDLE